MSVELSEKTSAVNRAATQPDFTRGELRALIVEDENLIAEELRGRRSRLGFSVIAAVDSADESIGIAMPRENGPTWF